VFDIVFISYNEPNAEENLFKLKERFPLVKHVHGVTGIHQAHIAAAKRSFSPMFWVVDGDAEVLDTFNFDHKVVKEEYDIVHVWRSRNPINGLEYGYGGVKLLPKMLTLKVDISSTDMTTSISPRFKAMEQVSNITAFNTDPFSTWRSAFRECTKLAVLNNEESTIRLNTWCTVSSGEYSEFAIAGALAGRAYGEKNASNKEALCKINDFSWLQDRMSLEKFQQ
jgi:hypothetical protein